MSHPHDHQPHESHDHGSHSHGDIHPESPEKDRKKRMQWAIGITGAILVLEAVGGVMSHSLALLSDAGHMLTDLAALLISLAAMIMADKPASSRHTYGWARLEVLAALGNSITFFLLVAGVAWEAIYRLSDPVLPDWKTMGLIALIGLLANVLSAWFLHGAEEHDLNMKSAWIHVMGDLASSVGVLIGVFFIARTGWTWIDPVLSLVISGLIALSAFRLFRRALRILLESAPRNITPESLREVLLKDFPEIKDVHHVHLWEVGSGEVNLTAHLVLEDQPVSQAEAIVLRAERRLKDHPGIHHATFQLETPKPACLQGPHH